MSEERFSRIETKIDGIETKIDGIETKVDGLEAKVDGLEARIGDLDRKIDEKADDLGRQMRVLHEDLVGRIAALAPEYDEIDRRIAEGDNKLREEVLIRIEPLEAAERARHGR